MKWKPAEIERLAPILERIRAGLEPLVRDAAPLSRGSAPLGRGADANASASATPPEDQSILVLCSAGGELPLWLAQRLPQARFLGLELSPEGLAAARTAAAEVGLEGRVEFQPAQKTRIPFPDASFDGLVSEFILFPTPVPTEIGQPEMARVLKPGASMLITDVIVPEPLPEGARTALQAIGLDYLCEATPADFCAWMESAGLVEVAVEDLTPLVRPVWEQRQRTDPDPAHREGYALLLEHPGIQMGEGIFYIYVCGRKPQLQLLNNRLN